MKKLNMTKGLLFLWGVLLFFLDKNLSLYSILASFICLLFMRENEFKTHKQTNILFLSFCLLVFCTSLVVKYYSSLNINYTHTLSVIISISAGMVSYYLVYFYIKTLK
jgi:hypothetical protein